MHKQIQRVLSDGFVYVSVTSFVTVSHCFVKDANLSLLAKRNELMTVTRKMTIWLITTVVLLQSFMATAGSLDIHIYDPVHAQTPHMESTETVFFHHEHEHEEYAYENHSTEDCHHCGHCSGMHLHWVSDGTPRKLSSAISVSFLPLIPVKLPIRISELLRPPIA